MATKKGNNLPKKGKILHRAKKAPPKVLSYEKSIARALHKELDGSHKMEKTLMRWTGAGGRTVKNWVSGIRGPSAHHLVALMENSDEVFRVVLGLAHRESRQAPDRISAAKIHLVEAVALLEGGEANR